MGNTILLADKSITIQKIVELTFADDEYEIRCVNDGQAAIDAIPQIRPDIILADISLPIKNGYEICRILRTDPAFMEYANIPVILLAGIYETMDEERAKVVEEKVREVGASDLLSKPFDPQVLTSKVKELMSLSNSIPAAGPESEQNLFSEAPATAPDIFSEQLEQESSGSTQPLSLEEPADDSEKTMMLPGKPVYSSNMFAETFPFDSEEAKRQAAGPHLDPDAVRPVDEPMFDGAEMEEAEASYQPKEVVEETPQEQEEDYSAGSAFIGDEERVIEIPTAAAAHAQAEEESPFGEDATRTAPATPSGASVLASSDEPFGDDVFGEPTAPIQWNAAATSEEESPFGLPEPPPAPPPEKEAETVMMKPPVNESAAMEDLWNAPAAEEPVLLEEADREELEEIISEPPSRPDFGEDTWGRARAAADRSESVEELFEESAAAPVEEAEELKADSGEIPIVPPVSEPTQAAETPAVAVTGPAFQGGATELTDEVIERIAERVAAKLSEKVLAEIVWQVVPDLAEKMIRRELEKLHAGED